MKKFCLILLSLITACGSGDRTADEPTAIPEGTCLQLEVVVGEGYQVDGQPKSAAEVGPALSAALAAGNRTAIVDVTCGEGATMEPVRVLHEAMADQDLYRIQYFRAPDPPIPLVLPDSNMLATLERLPAESRCRVEIAPDGSATIAGAPFERETVEGILRENPGVIFAVIASDDVKYADFTRILGDITGSGAQRVSVRLASR